MRTYKLCQLAHLNAYPTLRRTSYCYPHIDTLFTAHTLYTFTVHCPHIWPLVHFLLLFCFPCTCFKQAHLTLSSFCRISSATAGLKIACRAAECPSRVICTCAVPVRDPRVQCGYVQHIIKNSNWPPPGSGSDPVFPQHLIQHVNSDFHSIIMIGSWLSFFSFSRLEYF